MKINEIVEGIVSNIKPGQSAEIDNQDGTKTVVDLKKATVTKDPKTKTVKVVKKNTGTQQDPASQIKAGDKVEPNKPQGPQ